jgi:TonB family protein
MTAATTSTLLASTLLATASLILLSLPANAAAPGDAKVCEPRAVQNETRFPVRAQLRGHRGTVYLNVRLDENGRATATSLYSSSGHRLLDRAAEQSVRKNWVFDVSSCTSKDLPADRLVAIEYRNDEYSPLGKVARNSSVRPSLAALPAKASRE